MEQPKLKNIKLIPIPRYEATAEKFDGDRIFLNSNDVALLILCSTNTRHIGEISRILSIAHASVSARLSKLESFGLISINKNGHGKKTNIKTLIEIPEELKLGGEE